MSKKLNSMPDYQARMPRQPHDVSQSTAFTCCPGALSPVYFDMLHTGDEIFFSGSQYTRMNPLVTQALGKIDVHLDYFFVPLTVMYTPSSSMFYQTDDLVSSAFADSQWDTANFPKFVFDTWFSQFSAEKAKGSVFIDHPSNPKRLNNNYFDCYGVSIFRMFDFLDMQPDVLYSVVQGTEVVSYPDFTPWFALAYQAIYQLYFRNDDREKKNYHYNIDGDFRSGVIVEDLAHEKSIFTLNYASRPKDYFNSVKVSPIGSSVSMLNGGSISDLYKTVNNWLSSTEVTPGSSYVDEQLPFGEPGVTQVLSNNPDGSSNFISSNQIRQLFMVDKLLRVVGRAEKNYESQFLAHYGIKIPHDVMHNITHIGHDQYTLVPDAIESKANTYDSASGNGSALGEIGGTCAGMLSGTKKSFKAPFHGVFMVISHIVPRKRYVLGLNKLHQLNSPSDFWQPEFDRKGMQPLFRYEGVLDYTSPEGMIDRKGWQYAYEQFKRKSDRVLGAFVPSTNSHNGVNTYSPWVIASQPYTFIDSSGSQSIMGTGDVLPTELLISPTDLNINMQVPHNTGWPQSAGGVYWNWQFYNSDPFICDFNLNCTKVNFMSEYGEPEL